MRTQRHSICYRDMTGRLPQGHQVVQVALLFWLAAMPGVSPGQAAGGAEAAGEIKIVQIQGPGIVEVLAPGATVWVRTATNQILGPGFRVRTSLNARAALLWSENSVVPMNALTELEIQPPENPKSLFGLNLLRGIISFFHRDKPGQIRAATRGAAASIRGTEFVLEVDTSGAVERTRLSVIDGWVQFSNGQGSQELTNNQESVVDVGQAPTPPVGFNANNRLQWCFYYPGILDLKDLPLAPAEEAALADSLRAYRQGDLLTALRLATGQPLNSDAARLYFAAVQLSVGRVAETEAALAALPATPATDRIPRLATALRVLIAAVRREPNPSTIFLEPSTALSTELLAASYYQQSLAVRGESLQAALRLARAAAASSPAFGFAWERVAELEFSFGRIDRASAAFEKSYALSPRNAEALALEGFLLAAQNKTRLAIEWFQYAIDADSSLGNAWLGRGLCRIRHNDLKGGREDLLIAAALEPQRSLLRSYLGKGFAESDDYPSALRELGRAKYLDPADPTPWLYLALLKEQENRFNEAIHDLERSQDLNKNRNVYRSSLLLDQDRGVRSANLARIYAEAGLDDIALQEASRAVAADYNNYSAHLFLSDAYNQLQNDNLFDLRYETPKFSEYLLAKLLGPADGRLLAQPVTQQEYTRLFDRDSIGITTDTEYLSRGAWNQYAAQYGTYGNTSYAIENWYTGDRGDTVNGFLESLQFSLKLKQTLSANDSVYFEGVGFSTRNGDLAQRYYPTQAVAGVEVTEKRQPSAVLGWNHQWSTTQRTLLLLGRFYDSLEATNPHAPILLEAESFGTPTGFLPEDLSQNYHSRLTFNALELQHLAQTPPFETIVGTRVQGGKDQVSNLEKLEPGNSSGYEIYFGNPGDVIASQSLELHFLSVNTYLYEYWQIARPLLLIGGISYDYENLPRNLLFGPVESDVHTEHQLSPKVGLVLTPTQRATVRAAYSQSLGGFEIGQSVRLEPTQIAGFVQSYRNLFPDSLVSEVDGAHFETTGASVEYRLGSGTYLAASAELLRSRADRDVGAVQGDLFTSLGPAFEAAQRLRFQERSIDVSAHQLFLDWFSMGARYKISDAWLSEKFPDVDPSLGNTSITSRGILQTLKLSASVQHPSGAFLGTEAVWWSQQLRADLSGTPGDSLWQENILAGYRSPRRHAQITAGILNLSGGNYRLHPINLYPNLPRERTFFVRLQLNF